MALTVQATGTQTATIGTEHTLVNANTTAGVWELAIDTKNLVNGDELELRIYVKTLTGDANPLLVYYADYFCAQGDGAAPGSSAKGEVVKYSPPVSSPYSISMTLKQTAGTGRSFDWRAVTF
jgi:hypothetical protein